MVSMTTMAAGSQVRLVLWSSGVAAFWLGVWLAQINGYPMQVLPSLLLTLGLAVFQALVLWRLAWGREVLGSLALGLLPLYVGFYRQSGHWVSEVWVLGLLVSLAAGNGLLACRWHEEWCRMSRDPSAPAPAGAPRALVVTLIHIILIIGLVFIWYFPATPLPGRDGAWLVAVLAVANQELVKRKYYTSLRGSLVLAWMSAALNLALTTWLLVVCIWRAAG